MTPQEIDGLVAPGESETLELKRTTRLRQEGAHAACAMLNHRGGYVLYGVEPDGKIVGQQVSDRTIEEVAQELGRIDPPAMTSIRIDPIDLGNGRSVIAVAVQSGHHQPYSYRGSAYRRVGNTNQVMTRDEYNRILLEAPAQRAALGKSLRRRLVCGRPGPSRNPAHGQGGRAAGPPG